MEHTTLYYRQGSSDKVYQASIEPKDGSYVVNFAYGRRGSTLNTGTKTTAPVPYDQAKVIYNKLINEKVAKGYTPGEDGTPYQNTPQAEENTGIHCQLLNPIEEDQVQKFIHDPAYWMQEKMDGRRLLLSKRGNEITGINRLGLAVGLPQTISAEAINCPIDFIIDGEAIGETLYAFDVLQIGDEKLESQRYGERYLRLMNLLASFQHRHIQLVETTFLPKHKAERFHKLKQQNAEGIAFKHIDGKYTPGRPSSGGSQFKFKFCETASFIVAKINAKRSIALQLFDGKQPVGAGNVTIPANHDIPKLGSVVEVRYLYAFRDSGCIYQPVYLGEREDIGQEECVVAQLKYKPEATEQAA